MPQLIDANYEERAKAYLAKYAGSGMPQPYFFGVILVAPNVKPSLSRNGLFHYEELQKQAAREHVQLLCFSALCLNKELVELTSETWHP